MRVGRALYDPNRQPFQGNLSLVPWDVENFSKNRAVLSKLLI